MLLFGDWSTLGFYGFIVLADDLGYSSTSVFYRSFQKETGVTAGKYMKEVRAMHGGQKNSDIDDDSAKLPD